MAIRPYERRTCCLVVGLVPMIPGLSACSRLKKRRGQRRIRNGVQLKLHYCLGEEGVLQYAPTNAVLVA